MIRRLIAVSAVILLVSTSGLTAFAQNFGSSGRAAAWGLPALVGMRLWHRAEWAAADSAAAASAVAWEQWLRWRRIRQQRIRRQRFWLVRIRQQRIWRRQLDVRQLRFR